MADTGSPPPEISEEDRKRIFREEQLKVINQPLFGRKNLRVYLSVVALMILGGAALFWEEIKESPGRFLYVVLAALAFFGFQLALAALLRVIMRAKIEQDHRIQLTQRTEELQEKLEEDFFTNLVKINFKYIDKYYLQTQLQANKSFLLSCAAATVSFGTVIAGVILIYLDKSQATAGYVATAAGSLGEFVAAVFFYLYSQTIIKMGEYHQKLVLTQNIGLALKITEDLQGESRVNVQTKLIETLTQDINKHLTGSMLVTPAKTRENN